MDAGNHDGFFGAGIVGVIIVEALHLYLIIYLNLLAALANLDPALDEAGRTGRGMDPIPRITCRAANASPAGRSPYLGFTELGTPLMLEFRQVTPADLRWPQADGDECGTGNSGRDALDPVLLYLAGRVLLEGQGRGAMPRLPGVTAPAGSPGRRLGDDPAFATVIVAAFPHAGVVLASLSGRAGTSRSSRGRSPRSTSRRPPPPPDRPIRNSLWLSGRGRPRPGGRVAARIIVRTKLRGRAARRPLHVASRSRAGGVRLRRDDPRMAIPGRSRLAGGGPARPRGAALDDGPLPRPPTSSEPTQPLPLLVARTRSGGCPTSRDRPSRASSRRRRSREAA